MAKAKYSVAEQLIWPNGNATVMGVSGTSDAWVYTINVWDTTGVYYDREIPEAALASITDAAATALTTKAQLVGNWLPEGYVEPHPQDEL